MPSRLELFSRSADSSSRIPPQLEDDVPECARTCLSDYIEEQYNQNCTGSDCICGVYSSDGNTLGELALKCAKGPDCNGQTVSEQAASRAYNLCSQEIGAVPGLYTTLTVYQTSRTTSSSTMSSSTATKTTQTSSSMVVTRTTMQLHTLQTASATVGSSAPPAATSAWTAPETVTPPTSNKKSTLTSAQAVGVAIGAVSGVITIIAIIYVLSCIRRRRSKRQIAQRQSYDFVDKDPADFLPPTYECTGSRAPLGELLAPRSKTSFDKHNTFWPSHGYAAQWPTAEQAEQAEHYNQSGSWGHGRTLSSQSTTSNTSMRTLSQLLPERPGSKPPPPPSKSMYASLIRTPATIFEEERVEPPPRAVLPGLPAHPAVLKARQPRALEAASPPVLSIHIPRQSTGAPSTHSLGNWPLPPHPARVAPYDGENPGGSSAVFSSSKTSLLDYYASADSGLSPQDPNSPTPIEETTQVRRPAPAAIVVTQPSYRMRATRDSIASDASRRTSFESTNNDEITPPEEDDKRLSPVAESPISNLRYPRVPRSSNQAVPRSPVYSGNANQHQTAAISRPLMVMGDQKSSMHKPIGSGSNLAARRRGDQLAQLAIMGSAHTRNNHTNSAGVENQARNQRQQSPLKDYGRTKSQPRPAPSFPLTVETISPGSLHSPLWEPKVTPSRKGDDFYLSVSVATPQGSHFHDLYDRR